MIDIGKLFSSSADVDIFRNSGIASSSSVRSGKLLHVIFIQHSSDTTVVRKHDVFFIPSANVN